MSSPSVRSVPTLWIGLALVCLGIFVWVGSVAFFMSSTMSHLDGASGGPLPTMWPLLLSYAASAICVLTGIVMLILGFIRYSHLLRRAD
jgi:hypothetical protein